MKRHRFGMNVIFSLVVLGTMVVSFLVSGVFAMILVRLGFASVFMQAGPLVPILLVVLSCLLVGSVVAPLLSRRMLRPVKTAIRAVNELAEGDFSVCLELDQTPELAELSESFNRMAEELRNTELLRTDFVNDFSHEFKTPIVSIKGFAEMLKYEDLSEEERGEYLDLIIRESGRLSDLAVNVLNLSRVEKQTSLTERARFNAGEQLRRTVILLQPKWERKGQDIAIEGDDVVLVGSEELMGQVWLNLLDNAVKFSPEGGKIFLSMRKTDGEAVFVVQNTGTVIPPEKLGRIFDRFYQGDASHATPGNGLGLALVKRITDLHGGTVTAESDEAQGTVFTARIPIEQ